MLDWSVVKIQNTVNFVCMNNPNNPIMLPRLSEIENYILPYNAGCV